MRSIPIPHYIKNDVLIFTMKFFRLLANANKSFKHDRAPLLAAALSYYAIFSITPLIVILVAIVGLVFGQAAVEGEILLNLQEFIGVEGAGFIQDLVKNANRPGSGMVATIISLAILLFAASGLIANTKRALNIVWSVPKKKKNTKQVLTSRVMNFINIFGLGLLIFLIVILNFAVALVNRFAGDYIPFSSIFIAIVGKLIPLVGIFLLFMMAYRILPDVEMSVKDAAPGALVGSFLFLLGQVGFEQYLNYSGFSSVYGAAGALVIIMVWTYYSAQIFLFGAEFTKVYAKKYGSMKNGN